MVHTPAGEEREMKLDILKIALNSDAIRPNAIAIETILSGVARHEEETVARWIDELTQNPQCPLNYFTDDEVAVCFEDRQDAIMFISDLESDPWYQPDLD